MAKKENFSFDYGNLRDKSLEIISNKKFQIGLTLFLFLLVLFVSSSIRISNWDLLDNQVTGEKIPLALDPYYFLRVSETILDTGNNLPEKDLFRAPTQGGVDWTKEIMPLVVVYMYKFSSFFDSSITLAGVNVFSPVFFFIIGLIFFFIFCYVLTKSKFASLLSTSFLAFSIPYLYRTMAGFSDHEAIGMIFVFICLTVYVLSFNFINKDLKKSLVAGILFGLSTTLVLVSWAGATSFIFLVVPFSFLLYWLIEQKYYLEKIVYYFSWIASFIFFSFFFNHSFLGLVSRLISPSSILVSFVAVFILVDYLLIKNKGLFGSYLVEKYQKVYSFFFSIVAGIIGLLIIGRGPKDIFSSIWTRLFNPLGESRVGATVAENSQPFLEDLIVQLTPSFFWLFIFGLILIGFVCSREVKGFKEQNLFFGSWVIFIFTTLFTRISSNSIFNGSSFVSQSIYFLGFLFFGYVFLKLYFEKNIEKSLNIIFLFPLVFFVMIGIKSSVRIFFLIIPFISFVAGYTINYLYNSYKKSEKKYEKIFLILFLIGFFLGAYLIYTNASVISVQAKFTGPSANSQWQGSMDWVDKNTPEGSLFLHWWDYGYWVQTLGNRPSVTDGGHATGNFGDHLIGRYVLTTPNPDTAYSFMKTWGVNYLLIDPTDFGKYAAYSKIGSDESGEDRFSIIQAMQRDSRQTVETESGEIFVYTGGIFVDEDISYKGENGEEIFLPQNRAVVGGITIGFLEKNGGLELSQPNGIFFDNNQRFTIPLRYVYFDGQIHDFGGGLDAIAMVVPALLDSGSIDLRGSVVYLSPKVSDSLFARLYLLNDPFNQYSDLRLVRTEDDSLVSSISSSTGFEIGDFVYYQGLRGPIKIWEVGYPEEIIKRDEFLKLDGEYAELDNFDFRP